jgi:hypothetical protein
MTNKIMVLGIGVPKAGTTWLHDYLLALPGFSAGFMKEYHIWDAVRIPECSRYLVPEGRPVLSQEQLLRREMQRYPDAYAAYFAHLASKPNITHVADITPSYCALPAETLRMMYAGLVARGLKVRVVLLLRDPVERCWSMLRMYRANPRQRSDFSLDYNKSDDLLLRDYALTANARIRTSYDRTLKALAESGIPRESVFIGLYERMFEPHRLEQLSSFLGVPYRPEMAERKINASPKNQAISDETRAFVAQCYAQSYVAVGRIMPKSKELWSGFKYLEPVHSAV